jgi:hypothetical protein
MAENKILDGIEAYIKNLAETNRVHESLKLAGIPYHRLVTARVKNPEIPEMEKVAKEKYRELLAAEVHRRAVDGIEDAQVFQGKLTGDVKTHYSDRLLELHVKAHCPEYRDKLEADVNVKGGVLVIPSTTSTESEWLDAHKTPSKIDDEPESEALEAPAG